MDSMKGYSLVSLVVAGIVLCHSAPASAKGGYTAPVCTLSKVPKVTAQNAHEVLKSLWDDQTIWVKFMDCVESGESTWIDVAFALHQFSDAGAHDEIDSSLGEALGNNPVHTLQEAAVSGATPELVCSGPDVDDPRFDGYDLSMAEIERRQATLRRVKDKSLDSEIQVCLADLEDSKKDIASFYKGYKTPAPKLGTAPPPPE
jgi:hypothetical protein